MKTHLSILAAVSLTAVSLTACSPLGETETKKQAVEYSQVSAVNMDGIGCIVYRSDNETENVPKGQLSIDADNKNIGVFELIGNDFKQVSGVNKDFRANAERSQGEAYVSVFSPETGANKVSCTLTLSNGSQRFSEAKLTQQEGAVPATPTEYPTHSSTESPTHSSTESPTVEPTPESTNSMSTQSPSPTKSSNYDASGKRTCLGVCQQPEATSATGAE